MADEAEETIGVVKRRKLLEMTHTLSAWMLEEEFQAIMGVYVGIVDRIEKEGNYETDSTE